jgi:hypothetical protein
MIFQELHCQRYAVTFLPEPDIGDIILSTTSAGELLSWYGPSGLFWNPQGHKC